MAAITGAPVVMAFMGADAAIAQEKQSDVELINSAMSVLDEETLAAVYAAGNDGRQFV